MWHLIRWVVGTALSQGLLLWLLAWLLPGVSINSFGAAILAGIIVTVVTAALWPSAYRLAARFHPLLFPLVSFVLMGVVINLADNVIDLVDENGMTLDGLWDGILLAIGLTIGNTVLGAFFSFTDDDAYDRFVTRALRRRYSGTPKTDVPGVLFLEVDGLAEPILRQAMAAGYAPTMQRWLDTGSHTLAGWEPDLSSQTSASQAGILLGSNEGIPAFRWWDKQLGQLMVSSKMATAQALEAQLASDDGLLAPDGGSRFNVFSGGASDCVATFSVVGQSKGVGQFAYFLYFTNPYTLARTMSLLIADVVRERWEAWRQHANDVQPRIHRHFSYAFVRAGTTVAMQEASRFMLLADMYRGVPVVYNTFFAYDEVAHHSGIDRPDALKVLRKLDRLFAHLERAARAAPRPYRLVVLSDHGQSMGATFKQRYGKTLGELVDELIAEDYRVAAPLPADEGVGNINAALTEAIQSDSRTARLVRRTLQSRVKAGEVAIGTADSELEQDASAEALAHDVIVLASGNLGLLSFTQWRERMTYEQIVDTFPGLVPGLINHPGISFILVHGEADGGLVIGPGGVRYLDHDYAAGVDPLAAFDPNAARHLKRTDSFATAPDILVISMVDHATGEVAAFEELVGCHGGLGGPQTHPFVLYPADLPRDPTQPIVGAAGLHAVLKGWVRHLHDGPLPAAPDAASASAVTSEPGR